jgi:uncharacterized protein (TIGR03067 family)
MRRLVLLLFVSGTCYAVQPSDDAVKKELKLFAGKWKAIAANDVTGNALDEEQLKKTTLVVDGDKFTMKTGTDTIKGTFIVDPTKKPKTIDAYIDGSKDMIFRGIYEQTGDTRKSCFGLKDRPDTFRKEKDYLYLEWKRVK